MLWFLHGWLPFFPFCLCVASSVVLFKLCGLATVAHWWKRIVKKNSDLQKVDNLPTSVLIPGVRIDSCKWKYFVCFEYIFCFVIPSYF